LEHETQPGDPNIESPSSEAARQKDGDEQEILYSPAPVAFNRVTGDHSPILYVEAPSPTATQKLMVGQDTEVKVSPLKTGSGADQLPDLSMSIRPMPSPATQNDLVAQEMP
jgi:hypothetical protein